MRMRVIDRRERLRDMVVVGEGRIEMDAQCFCGVLYMIVTVCKAK